MGGCTRNSVHNDASSVKVSLGIALSLAQGRYIVCDECPGRTPKTPYDTPGRAEDQVGDRASPMASAGNPGPLLTLYFPFDVAQPQSEHATLLAVFAKDVLPGLRSHEVSVFGFTDDIGPQRYNDHLASSRAEAIAEHLRSLHVSTTEVQGHGRCGYQASNETEAGRAKNRRVEIWSGSPSFPSHNRQ